MFNGYNDSTLISYEFNQEREKKSDNVSKFSYGHDGGVQPAPTQPNNRQSEFWSGKPNFIGIPNVVKCNCTGCYPTTENQSYQVESARHRPWLPKTYSVPLSGSNECKLPPCQWDNTFNQICYSDSNVPYGQENGGKHPYYRQFQTPNQPSVIISANKQKSEMGYQNGIRQPVMCNPGYDLTKRINGRSYYDGDKYSLGAYSMNQIPRLPVEPYTKAVPSNLNQNRVPSAGLRKENSSQYDHYNGTKICSENYHAGLSPVDLKNSGIHVDYSYFNRDSDYYTEIRRNSLATQNRKDCAVSQPSLEQHYPRPKHPENLKGCDMFYPNLEKNQMDTCIQRIENDGINRISRSVMVCNDFRYADERPQVFPYQNNIPYRNYIKPEYSQFNSQFAPGFQESDKNQCRTLPQQLQNYDHHPQVNNSSAVDPQKDNSDKTQSFGRPQVVLDAQPKSNYLETVRSEDLPKNGSNKISPLRLLRKKKFVAAPQEISSATNTVETPALDVRKFWSTWAEEDENICPAQVVVLDCQNIDPEQAKLLNFYETDPSRPISLENVFIKNPDCGKDNIENVKTCEVPVDEQEKQVEISPQIEPIVKNVNETPPELEAVNTFPKKCKSQEHRKKKTEEVLDKWTEKKFDFLKKSEESKAAEIFRHEEEKKRIFERRLSFQQIGVNKFETSQKDVNKFEENSQSNSPKEKITADLPTSEYRRNKFLDYSEVMVNGYKNTQKVEVKEADESTEVAVKKEEPNLSNEKNSFAEMNDILKKISEINFQETKSESDLVTSKKAKKTKKKKLDQQEADARTDLKLETTSKPTIKFSIQKSHDLKISFKVLNKKYEEEAQSEETKPIEDTNTELITLKYKSIQNGNKMSDSKKTRKKLRRKKHAPILKIKKSKHMEEERDPLVEDDEAKIYPTDGFQVQETVDSAKIKLTFKRHKANLPTEYKINNEGFDAGCENYENRSKKIEKKYKKKFKKAKRFQIVDQMGIESTNSMEQNLDVVSDSDGTSKNDLESIPKIHVESSSSSDHPHSVKEEEIYENPTTPPETTLPEKRLCEFIVQNDVMRDSKCEIDGEEHVQLIVNCDEANGLNDKGNKFSPDENVKDAISKCSDDEKTEEKIQEISLDFIRSINSPDIEQNPDTEKTEEIEASDTAEERDTNGGEVIESTNENHSNFESSYNVKNNSNSPIHADPVPISVDKTNASLESNSGKNVDVSEENITFGKCVTDSVIETENVYSFRMNSTEHITSKLEQANFAECDSIEEKIRNFQSDPENDVEPKISNVGSKSKIELEDISIKSLNLEELENRLEHPEGDSAGKPDLTLNFDVVGSTSKIRFEDTLISRLKYLEDETKSEPDVTCNSEQNQMNTSNNTKQPKTNIDEEMLLNRNIIQASHTTIIEGNGSIKHSETFDDQSDQFFDYERNSESKSQGIDSPKFESEQFKALAEDEGNVEGCNKDEWKTLSVESDSDNGVQHEKVEKLKETSTVEAINSELPCVRLTSRAESERIEPDDSLNRKSPPSDNEQIGDKSFALNCQNTNICDHLGSKIIDENIQSESVQFSIENITLDSSTDQVISSSDDINDDSGNATEQEVEMICDSQNTLFSANSTTQIDPFSPALDEAVEDSSGMEAEDCSQFESEKPATQELPECIHFSHKSVDSTQSNTEPENCNQELYCDEPKFNYPKTEENEIVDNFEGSAVNLEEGKLSEALSLNDTVTSSNDQEDVLLVKNVNQLDRLSDVSSPVERSKENSCTIDSTEMKLSEQTDFVNNSLPVEVEYNSVELPGNSESDLEDGEIVDDSSEDSESTEQPVPSKVRKAFEFKVQKPERRYSVSHYDVQFHSLSSCGQRKFTKSKSCPPRFKIESVGHLLTTSLEDIPLPVGPPPRSSCFCFDKINKKTEVNEEHKEKDEKVSAAPVLIMNDTDTVQELSQGSPFIGIELQNCRNPSPPVSDALGTNRSKIKFSLIKRSRFSKLGFQSMEPKTAETPKLVEKSNLNVKEATEDLRSEVIKILKQPEIEDTKPDDEPEQMLNEIPQKPNLSDISTEINEPEITEENTVEPNEETSLEPIEAPQKLNVEVTEPLESLEIKTMELSEPSELETFEFSEQLELEIVDSNIDTKSEISVFSNKIRTPDYVSETVEEISECQIAEVPNESTTQSDDKDQKNDTEIESLCEDANIEVVDVMTDFMRDEFYEDIPTSEDLPNGDSVDEKVNDDKFRNIMQNCLENAKKFLNVGNLKLFSCSVDDLLELDNQENEPATNHISRDVLLTSCDDINDDLGLNEKFQPGDISMEFIPSDVCPEILPVDNWPYLEEEVPSSPLKPNESDLIPENTISETVSGQKRTAKECENYKRFRRKSLVGEEETPGSKMAAHRRKTIDSFLTYTKLNGIDKPNESLKCRLSLEKLTKNGVEFISSDGDLPKKRKDIESNKKLNYKSPLWQPKVMLIRISENEVKQFRKTKIRRPSSESRDSLPPVKKQKSEHTDSESVENEVILSIPEIDSIKGMITTSDVKKHKPRFRNLHTKRKTEQDQNHPKAVETALSELFKDFDRESKNYKSEQTDKNMKDEESKIKSESKSDRHSSKSYSHKSKHDHRDRRREKDKEHYRHKEKHRHERSKHDGEKRHKSNHSAEDRKRSVSKSNGDEKKDAWACEVCGFDDASERVAHIKNHPFHCQSCHLAFKTESYFTSHLREMHKDIRNQHHCLLCEMSFDTEEEHQRHLETREHTHLESVEKNTINTLFTLLTGAPCPVLGVVEMKPEWLPNQPGTVHFYHQATPLSLALQYLKMHHDLTSYSEVSKVHPN